MTVVFELNDLQGGEHALGRVQVEIDAVPVEDLSPMNVEPMGAYSQVLAAYPRIMVHREPIARLPDFDMRNVDSLRDYAMAGWHVYVNNLPSVEPAMAGALIGEAGSLRGTLVRWAVPLAASGALDQAALDHILAGSGHMDTASDLVALVSLYRPQWDQVKNKCGVTEADLNRAAVLGPIVFALVSLRENRTGKATSEGTLRVRRAWTVVDRAYTQCRRALAYVRHAQGDADIIAPSLRRNTGPRSSQVEAESAPSPVDGAGVAAPVSSAAAAAAAPAGGAPIGGAGGPFAAPPSSAK